MIFGRGKSTAELKAELYRLKKKQAEKNKRVQLKQERDKLRKEVWKAKNPVLARVVDDIKKSSSESAKKPKKKEYKPEKISLDSGNRFGF